MVQALFFNHLYDPNSLVRDNEVKAAMAGMGVACQSFNSDLLFEPWEVLSDEGEPLTCFQEYWDRCAHGCHRGSCQLQQPRCTVDCTIMVISADSHLRLLSSVLCPLHGQVSSCQAWLPEACLDAHQ